MSKVKYLWSFYWDCGRSGDLEGLFVATEADIESIIGRYASFGEVLGKHSDVYGTIEEGDITKIDVSPQSVEEVVSFLGDTWSGFNPLEYTYQPCKKCGEEFHPDELSVEGLCYECDEKEE